jgi:Zn-finger nucleic acid-binding protein
MNVPEALHCSGCGSELGLEPVAEPGTLDCATCGKPHTLAVVRSGSSALHDCGTCGGQFVEHAMLRELLESREPMGALTLGAAPRTAPADLHVRYFPCPTCGALMARKNFGGKSGVIVDVCRRHGVWFDAGELPRALAFVRAGGLAAPEGPREKAAIGEAPHDGLRYEPGHGAEHRVPLHEMESVDDIANIGRAILEGLVDVALGHKH